MVFYDISDHTSSTVALPEKVLTPTAVATNDFVTYYFVQRRSGSVEVLGAKLATRYTFQSAMLITRLVEREGELLYAFLSRTTGILQILLIWDDEHSLIIPLEPGNTISS